MPTNAKFLIAQMRQDFEKPEGTQLGEALDTIKKSVAELLYLILLRNTPVKTGRLAGGWTFTGSKTNRFNRFKIMPPDEVLALSNIRGAEITISNEVDYADSIDSKYNLVELSFSELMLFAAAKGIRIEIL